MSNDTDIVEALEGMIHEAEWMVERVETNDAARQGVRGRIKRAKAALASLQTDAPEAQAEEGRIFDLLEAVTAGFGEGTRAFDLRAGFARGTNGVDLEYVTKILQEGLTALSRNHRDEVLVRRVAEALYDEKIAVLGVKPERFSFSRAPQQEQLDYEAKAILALKEPKP